MRLDLRIFISFAVLISVCYFKNCHAVKLLTDEEYAMMPKLFRVDDYDDCMASFRKNPLYCNINLQLKPRNTSNLSQVWNIIQRSKEIPKYYKHDVLRLKVCASKSCPKATDLFYQFGGLTENVIEELGSCISNDYKYADIKGVPSETHCETPTTTYERTVYHVPLAVGFFALIAFVLFASFYEGLARNETKEEYDAKMSTKFGQVVSSFSLGKNLDRLRKENTELPEMKAMMGIRFMGVCITVASHSMLLATASPLVNPQFLEDFNDNIWNIIFTNFFCVVQTFFVLSGWLLTYNFFHKTKHLKTITFSQIMSFVLYRYVRLTGAMLLLVLFNLSWAANMFNGPNWDRSVGDEMRACQRNGWTNLLHINNYVNKEYMCMPHTWYVATDTQLFVISVFIVALMKKYEKYALKIVTTALVLATLAPVIINYIYEVDIVLRTYPEVMYGVFVKEPNFHMSHTSIHSNMAGYIIGILCGYLFYKHKGTDIFTNTLSVALWWFIWVGGAVSVIAVGHYTYEPNFSTTRLVAALYSGLYRPIFAMCVAILFYGLTVKRGGLFRRFLEWDILHPLGKITYCAYLVHTVPIRLYGGLLRAPIYLSHVAMGMHAIGDIFLAYFLGFLICLVAEMPISALQRMLIPNMAHKQSEGKIEHDKAHQNGSNIQNGATIQNGDASESKKSL